VPLIHANGIEVHYHLQGKGTPIVFLHPPCIASRVFTYLRNDLSLDHKTMLFDFRGHGRSATSQTPITFPLLVEDTKQLMDALEIKSAYICAYSLGTMVALEALLTYPERFRGAILLSGLPEVTDFMTRIKLNAALIAGSLRAKELVSIPIAFTNADSPETFNRLRGEAIAGDMNKWSEYAKYGLNYSVTDRLSDILQPVLLLCGEKDTAFKRYMRIMQGGLQNVSFALLPGIQHTLPVHGAADTGQFIREWIAAQAEAIEENTDVSSVPEAWKYEQDLDQISH
jgi:pimeloyl-ACP methyl ester carboxylesterase